MIAGSNAGRAGWWVGLVAIVIGVSLGAFAFGLMVGASAARPLPGLLIPVVCSIGIVLGAAGRWAMRRSSRRSASLALTSARQ